MCHHVFTNMCACALGALQPNLTGDTETELVDEVSYLKLKLVGMDEEHNHIDEQQKHHKAEGTVISLGSGFICYEMVFYNIILL